MSNKVKYQMLPTDDRTPAQQVDLTQESTLNSDNNHIEVEEEQQQLASSPPPAPPTVGTSTFVNIDLNDNKTNESKFVFLSTTNELPTYDEVIYQKQNEANGNNPSSIAAPTHYLTLPPIINLSEVNDIPAINNNNNEVNVDIGTDCIFITSFLVSFFFNWIGFFTCICLMPTMAGKYGALSGFGLSMVKWATIVRYQAWMVNLNDLQQRLFFWIFILAGFYLFFRGLVTYIKVKYNPSMYLRRREGDWWLFR